jgi:hypothetical protein
MKNGVRSKRWGMAMMFETDEQRIAKCPCCNNFPAYSDDPCFSFCDRYYRMYLSTLNIHPRDIEEYRNKTKMSFAHNIPKPTPAFNEPYIDLLDRLIKLDKSATDDEWFAGPVIKDDFDNEMVSVGPYELRSNKEAHYEDTICQVLGGEHDAEANASLIAYMCSGTVRKMIIKGLQEFIACSK